MNFHHFILICPNINLHTKMRPKLSFCASAPDTYLRHWKLCRIFADQVVLYSQNQYTINSNKFDQG